MSDRGPGLDKEAKAHIFERFYRAPQHRMSRAGTGLGLAIVKSVAEVHGGRVEVQSAPGAGATFSLWLPLEHRHAG
ncbi:MAG: ATP-binding protein [Myxococcota bacterium]